MSTGDDSAAAHQEITNGLGSREDTRKRPFRFTGQQDIILLQEVLRTNPFKDVPPTTAWAVISKMLAPQLAISTRCCRERTLLLLDQYIRQDDGNLYRYCSEQELVTKQVLLQQVREQYENGAGGYSTRICGGPKTVGRAPAEKDDNRDAEQAQDPAHVTLNKDCLLAPSTSQRGSSCRPNQEGPSTSEDQSVQVKRPRLINPLPPTTSAQRNSGSVTDEGAGPTEHVQTSAEAQPDAFLAQLVSRLASRLHADMRMREKARRLRRKELGKMCAKPSTTSAQRNSASVSDEGTGPTEHVRASGGAKPADFLAQLVSRLASRLHADNADAAGGSQASPQGDLPDEYQDQA